MKFAKIRQRAKKEWDLLCKGERALILIGTGTCGRSAGAQDVREAFKEGLKKNHDIECNIVEVGCMGLCYAEPLAIIFKPRRAGICYGRLTPTAAVELIENYLGNDQVVLDNALGSVGESNIKGLPVLFDTAVFKPQVRRVLHSCGLIDPTNINHYIANGGYEGFAKTLKMDSARIIGELKNSGLRGRGGAGFPTWRKWQFCLETKGKEKYIICNADEGDPGAFMNRALLEGNPHSVLEGMLIAGYTLKAKEGYIYCRAEYPLALERLKGAIKQVEECGLLGDNILDTKFSFRIKVKVGAGAFVCGEETALIVSIEGKRGMPSCRPPFPAVSGLWGKPTVINNVETLANVGLILQKGARWFAEYGNKKSKGTKTFALAGKVKHAGLIEVPLGIKLREIVYGIGNGILDDKPFKAIQTGGPSGGCLPATLLDNPVDYESLAARGSIMGSGGMVVMDEETCMVDIARYFLDFTQKESCGKCAPCRLGTKQMLSILEDITNGKGKPDDIELLVEIGEAVKAASLCGLGQTAPNPVLTTIRYFRQEYQRHINQKSCPAKVCKALISYRILADKCKGCQICFKSCPAGAVKGKKQKVHTINQSKCIKCGVCLENCPAKFSAVECVAGGSNKGEKQ